MTAPPLVHRVRPFVAAVLAAAIAGCGLTTPSFEAPAASERAALEASIAADSTDLRAVTRLAVLEHLAGSVSEVERLADLGLRIDPFDPALSLLKGMAAEEAGRVGEAEARYTAYERDHMGMLSALARVRRDAIAPLLRQIRVDSLLEAEGDAPAPAESGILVLPFAHDGTEVEDAMAAAVADLLSLDLGLVRRPAVDPRLVHVTLDRAGIDVDARAELGTGLRLARLFGVDRVLQGSTRAISPDTLAWDVTLLRLVEDRMMVDAFTIQGVPGDLVGFEGRLAGEAAILLGDVEVTERFGPPHVRSLEAMTAYGRALRALDAGETDAAIDAFVLALQTDGTFSEAEDQVLRLGRVAALRAIDREDEIVDIVRIAEGQRAVRALRSTALGAEARAVTGTGAMDRAVFTDLLGLDRVGAGVLLGIDLTLPGGAP